MDRSIAKTIDLSKKNLIYQFGHQTDTAKKNLALRMCKQKNSDLLTQFKSSKLQLLAKKGERNV